MPHSEALTVEKKVKGRKRHIVTDTQGHLLHVKVHAANEHDISCSHLFGQKNWLSKVEPAEG